MMAATFVVFNMVAALDVFLVVEFTCQEISNSLVSLAAAASVKSNARGF